MLCVWLDCFQKWWGHESSRLGWLEYEANLLEYIGEVRDRFESRLWRTDE